MSEEGRGAEQVSVLEPFLFPAGATGIQLGCWSCLGCVSMAAHSPIPVLTSCSQKYPPQSSCLSPDSQKSSFVCILPAVKLTDG